MYRWSDGRKFEGQWAHNRTHAIAYLLCAHYAREVMKAKAADFFLIILSWLFTYLMAAKSRGMKSGSLVQQRAEHYSRRM